MSKIYKKIIFFAVFFGVFWLIFALKVAPGSFTTQNIPLGHPQDLGFPLVCSDVGAEYAIVKVMSPEIKTPSCDGYRPLPDTSWFQIENSGTLFVDSSGYARAKMWTDIPLSDELYNQHFHIRVFITSNSNGMFQPAIISNFFIETEPKSNPAKPPAGKIGVAPSVLKFYMKNTRNLFTIFNNDSSSHNYAITVRKPVSESQSFPNLSPGFYSLKDTGSVLISPSKVKINPHSEIQISVRLISAASLNKPTEAILLVSADDSTKNFVRIKFEMDE